MNSDKSDVEGTPATTVCSGQSARIDALLAAIATAQMENGRLSAEIVAQQKDIEGLRQYRVNVKAKDARIEHLEASEAGLKAALAFLKGQVCVRECRRPPPFCIPVVCVCMWSSL